MTTSVSGSVLQAVRAMRPVLDEHRSWADEHACMAPAVLAAGRDAGIFTLLAPHEVGGAEASLPEALAVCAELAAGDATVYWHAGNSAALSLAAAYLQPEDRATVFAGPPGPYGFSIVRGGIAKPVDGGYRLTGRWPFLTGARDVTWAGVNGVVHDSAGPRLVDGMPDVRLFIVPAADFQVEDTWGGASAMRGTGSHAVTVDGALVPEGLAHAWTKPKLLDRPLYRLPSAFAGPVTNAAAAIGILRRAVEEAVVLVTGKVSRADGIAYRDKARIQTGVARASSTVDMLEGGLRDMATDVWTCAETGRVPAAARSRMWSTAFFALDEARRALSELVTVSTSAVYADRNPIETALRDIHAICAAMEPFRDYEEAAGRVLLGSRPDSPGF